MAEEKKPEVKKEKFKLAKEFKAFISKGNVLDVLSLGLRSPRSSTPWWATCSCRF